MESTLKIEGLADAERASDPLRASLRALGPEGLYDIPGYGKGTIAQLAIYVNLREWDLAVRLGVIMANALSANTMQLRAMSSVLEQLASDDVTGSSIADIGEYVCRNAPLAPTVSEFLLIECGMTKEDVTENLESYKSRHLAINRLQIKIQDLLSKNEFNQADLQVALNRAQTYFSSASTLDAKLAGGALKTAQMLGY